MRCLLHIVLNRIVIFAFILLAISNCSRFDEDDKLSLERRVYNGNELRLDGYYYEILENGYWYALFFYRNGIIRDVGNFSPNELEEKEEMFRSEKFNKNSTGKLDWCVYHIDSDKIIYEGWVPSDGGALPVYTRFGEIINDTTFHISKSQRVDGLKVKVRDRLYHFRQFSPKPDSVTHFIP